MKKQAYISPAIHVVKIIAENPLLNLSGGLNATSGLDDAPVNGGEYTGGVSVGVKANTVDWDDWE